MSKTLAERVRELRLEREMTVADLAHRAGLNWATIVKIERGERVKVWLPTLIALCEALDYPVFSILEDMGVASGVTGEQAERWRRDALLALEALPEAVREAEIEKLSLLRGAYRRQAASARRAQLREAQEPQAEGPQ